MRAIRASREQQTALQQLQALQLGAAMHERPPGTAQRSSYGSGLTHPEHDPKNSVMRSLIYGGDETGAGAPRGPRVQPHQGERPLGVDPASAQARAFHEQQLPSNRTELLPLCRATRRCRRRASRTRTLAAPLRRKSRRRARRRPATRWRRCALRWRSSPPSSTRACTCPCRTRPRAAGRPRWRCSTSDSARANRSSSMCLGRDGTGTSRCRTSRRRSP